MFPVEVFRMTLLKWIEILREQRIRFHWTGGLTGSTLSFNDKPKASSGMNQAEGDGHDESRRRRPAT